MKNIDFIAVDKYAIIIFVIVVFISTVSTQAEELTSATSDTISTRSESIHTTIVDTTSVQTGSKLPSINTVPIRRKLIPSSIDTSTLQSKESYHVADTASTQSKLIRQAVDTSTRAINYTGVTLSAFIPGSGQIYQSRYVMGGLFLAAEAATAGFAVYWSGEADARRSDAQVFRALSDTLNRHGLTVEGDTVMRDTTLLSRSGWYAVRADEADFEARAARHTFYNALAWAVGLHLYNALDALESGGLTPRGLEKNPTTAGLLAAVPFLGLGQLYNERPSKAGMLAMTQAGLALTAFNQHKLMSAASEKYNQMRDSTSAQYAYRSEHLSYWKSRYDSAFSSRNTYLWLSLFAYLYSIFDAVVDAHLSDFNAKIDLGTDLSVVPGGGGAAVSVTVGLKKIK